MPTAVQNQKTILRRYESYGRGGLKSEVHKTGFRGCPFWNFNVFYGVRVAEPRARRAGELIDLSFEIVKNAFFWEIRGIANAIWTRHIATMAIPEDILLFIDVRNFENNRWAVRELQARRRRLISA